jgi:sporulation protein YabP
MDDRNAPAGESHEVRVLNREQVSINAVRHVESFDDEEVVLDTELGSLTLKGEELHMKQLNLDAGTLVVEGVINSLIYGQRRNVKGRSRGFIDRLLR